MAASVSDHDIHGSPLLQTPNQPMRIIRIHTSVYATDSLLPSHRDQVLVSHLVRNLIEIAQTAREFTLPSRPATENEEDEEVTDGNVGLALSALRILVSCHQAGLPMDLYSTKDSKKLTDGSNAVQQQGLRNRR
jgi:hypothetical protein